MEAYLLVCPMRLEIVSDVCFAQFLTHGICARSNSLCANLTLSPKLSNYFLMRGAHADA